MAIKARVYVSTYAKYNEGNLDGGWVDVTDASDIDGFMELCAELHEDEDDPEFMFQDIDCDNDFIKDMISESSIDEGIWDAIEAIDDANIDEDVINAYISIYGSQKTIADTISDAEERYQGEYPSDKAFAEETAESIGAIDKDASWPMNCIDWELAARELMYDYSSHDGHYFRD